MIQFQKMLHRQILFCWKKVMIESFRFIQILVAVSLGRLRGILRLVLLQLAVRQIRKIYFRYVLKQLS